MRPSGRDPQQMRAVTIERNVAQKAEGSCIITFGNTKVFVTASVETTLPSWRRGSGMLLPECSQRVTMCHCARA